MSVAPGKAAILGAGVIGRGWAARFLLHGWDVEVFDQDPRALERVQSTISNAQEHVAALYNSALPAPGNLSTTSNALEAVTGARWIQESVPEDLQTKRSLYAHIQADLETSAVLASSTSGFKATDLSTGMPCAHQLMVCHPFNPVYLLPAVEVVPGERTQPEHVDTALSVLTTIGMKPIQVRREIDAHIADRLLEALWREALWLVADDIATTAEIDEVMRNGFGLRWAQMGLFETYRIAGGEQGMRHFLRQFGPALAWPWSKLTDVPNLDEALINKITEQSDRQAAGTTVATLEAQRDVNLVAILKALKETNHGAGTVLNKMDAHLADNNDHR